MPATMPDLAILNDLDADVCSTSGASTTVIAPLTGAVLHELPVSTPEDVADAFARARLAQLEWARAGFAARRAVLLRAHDLILERREELLDILQSETGKTRGQAFEEVFQSATVTRYNALSAAKALRGGRRRSALPLIVDTTVRYRAKGVVGIITPWNFPLSLAAMDVVPALAAGCGVVQKADDQGALSVLALRRAFVDAGLPPELWSVVTGDGPVIGGAVTGNADYICFTGSTATGRSVAVAAAERLVGASLELGGKNAMIVLDDVDPLKAAADAAYGCFASAGQLCVSVERIYVQRGIARAFTEAFAARVESLRLGSAFDYSTDVGSLTSATQLARVQAHVDDAVAKGATVLAGGRARPDLGPFFYEPTVLTDVTSDMDCAAGETFGPVVSVYTVDTDDEAVIAVNDSDYGLNASVMSGSTSRARAVASVIDAGSVNINEGYRGSFSTVDAPMGGIKQSGLGRRNGREGLLRFVDAVTVSRSTGLMQLPRTGTEFSSMAGPMILLARVMKGARQR
ncbi:succinate-semialdehyde dehydrogenase [Leifsonia sp. Leaf325]|nr:succinic semialdehyde dehydrogenase [Leifsonia sp. Leaf325]KQQ94510.1 succinate-semialdehyde dehydrogenase [Leifsonia sp. Leaf325]